MPPVGPARSDTINSVTIGFNWVPMRNLSVGANLENQKRSSNTPGLNFSTTISNITAALTF